MDIHKITDRLMNISSAEQTFKTGQIMKGKILKIYPNNKAQIKLASQNMIAQLELPLVVGEDLKNKAQLSSPKFNDTF